MPGGILKMVGRVNQGIRKQRFQEESYFDGKSYTQRFTDNEGFLVMTRLGRVWNNINSRIGDGVYSESDNSFQSYHEFVLWAEEEFGVFSKTKDGRYWAIDKDISGLGSYNAEAMFVPNNINTLFKNKSWGKEGVFGVTASNGVLYASRCGNFIEKRNDSIRVDTLHEGHLYWQQMMIRTLEKLLDPFWVKNNTPEIFGHVKLTKQLERVLNNIQSDVTIGVITTDYLSVR
jgi:hypothetical protein